MSEGISAPVRDFLLAHVDSIELLEVLLMLAGQPAATFSAEEISDHLRTAPQSATNRLRHLQKHGLVTVQPGGRFGLQPGAALADTLRQVAAAYRERRVAVVTLIYSRPSDVVRVFSNAFVLKKGPDDA